MKALNLVIFKLELDFPSEKEAKIVFNALEPEVKSAPSSRTKTSLNIGGNKIFLKIDAKDSTSLRASVNSYLRWVLLSQRILELK